MKILLVSTCKEKLHEREFILPYSNYLKGEEVKIVHYSEAEGKKLGWADRIIICGTGLADNNYLNHLDKFNWLKDVSVPVLGVCSGAQVIATTFGGKIIPNEEIGMVEVSGNLFGKKKFSAYALHQNGLDGLDSFEVTSISNDSIQSIKHRERPIYGVAFHPEVRNTWVLEAFLKIRAP